MKLIAFVRSLLLFLFLEPVHGSVLRPPVIPLASRGPYLNVHLPNARGAPWDQWPIFWTGQEVGLSIMARGPDRTVYPLLGQPHGHLMEIEDSHSFNISLPQYLGVEFDAATTNLTYRLPTYSRMTGDEGVEIVVSFISPITPTSTLRQSVPASYVEVSARGSHDVDIYIDINGMWVTGNDKNVIEWRMENITYDRLPEIRSWAIHRQNEVKFAEEKDRAEYGQLRFTTTTDGSYYQAGASAEVRRRFMHCGRLNNSVDSNFRSVLDQEPVFAFQKTMHLSASSVVTDSSTSVLFTIAHVRDELVQYASARGLTRMRPFWSSYLASTDALLLFHFTDFPRAKLLASRYSEQLYEDAVASGDREYADIVALSARQVLGATEFSGTPDKPLIFLKEISSNGNAQTIDVIFPSSPFFLYTNPLWLSYLLEPLLEHMSSGLYPHAYAMHDLGSHYPNLTGHPLGQDEYMPLEECGNMLIMGTALAKAFGEDKKSPLELNGSAVNMNENVVDQIPEVLRPVIVDDGQQIMIEETSEQWKGDVGARSWIKKNYWIWEQWTEYLIEFALEPENQLSTDDFAGWLPLQTNLALKGIIGIRAMSELATLMGYEDRANYYWKISKDYITKWQAYGLSRDSSHAKLAYNWYGSWTMLYSLFADALLCFHTSSSASTPIAPRVKNPLQQYLGSGTGALLRHSNFIPQGIYANQSSWYALSMQKYGIPLDSRHLYTKSDWEFQVAAVASPAVRKTIIQKVSRWLNETVTDRPFTDWYDTEGAGGFGGGDSDATFAARPVVGSHFAPLVLERACGGAAMDGLSHWNNEFHEDKD